MGIVRLLNPKKKLISFRVRPEDKSLYALINIWPTKRAMYEHKPLSRTHQALCMGVTIIDVSPKKSKKPNRKRGIFAELNFYRNGIGTEVISHEFTHAAFCWAERRKLDLSHVIGDHNWKVRKRSQSMPSDSVEEQFCYALGRMCRQFVSKCYDLGLY